MVGERNPGQSCSDLFDQTNHKFTLYLHSAVKGESFYSVEQPCCRKVDALIYNQFTVALLCNSGGRVFWRVLVASDITDCKQYEERLKHLSRHDQYVDDAVGELKRCTGSQFDPELVVLFISVLAENTIRKE